jgi:hypothetical protein
MGKFNTARKGKKMKNYASFHIQLSVSVEYDPESEDPNNLVYGSIRNGDFDILVSSLQGIDENTYDE